MTDDQLIIEIATEIAQLQHAIQSGIATTTQLAQANGQRDPATEPKHLRTGVNVALIQIGGLTDLLIKKGVFTEIEYLRSQRDVMRREVKEYETTLAKALGTKIKLS